MGVGNLRKVHCRRQQAENEKTDRIYLDIVMFSFSVVADIDFSLSASGQYRTGPVYLRIFLALVHLFAFTPLFKWSIHDIFFALSFVLSRCLIHSPPHTRPRSQSSAGTNTAAAPPTNANSSLARFNAAQSIDMASILRAKMAALRDQISTAPKKKGGRAEDEDEEEDSDDDW